MSIETVLTEVYKTTDGEIFGTMEEAEDHQTLIDNLKHFLVSYGPDLTEGRSWGRKKGLVAVNAKTRHKHFAEYACYKVLGSPMTFVQGVFDSNAMIPNWTLTEASAEDISEVETFIRVEERFAPKQFWGEGIHTEETS